MNDPRYSTVNDLHAQGYPALDRKRARIYAVRLLRRFGKQSEACPTVERPIDASRVLFEWGMRGDLGRRCWASSKPTRGFHKGWGRLIHDVAHMVWAYRHPALRQHDTGEHALETEIAYFVRTSTEWLTPREAPQLDPLLRVAQANTRDHEALERWRSKLERAKRAMAKLNRRIKARQRRVLQRGAPA